MNTPRASIYLGCFLRSYFVGAAYNPHGLQNIGFLYAVEPALVALYGPGEALRDARLRYSRQYNCHPFFTPLLLGVLLHMEMAIAAGQLDAFPLNNLKDTTANTLSAIGDSFFYGSLLGLWALSSACLILADMRGMAFGLTALCIFSLQVFKLVTFVMGVNKGMAVLLFLRRLDLINWGDRCKKMNAVLLGLFLRLALPNASGLAWGGVVMYLLIAGWLVGRLHILRIGMVFVLLFLSIVLQLFGISGCLPVLPYGL
jgi:PTS system mannose-specific IID component